MWCDMMFVIGRTELPRSSERNTKPVTDLGWICNQSTRIQLSPGQALQTLRTHNSLHTWQAEAHEKEEETDDEEEDEEDEAEAEEAGEEEEYTAEIWIWYLWLDCEDCEE